MYCIRKVLVTEKCKVDAVGMESGSRLSEIIELMSIVGIYHLLGPWILLERDIGFG
jgi:hypothetical protein